MKITNTVPMAAITNNTPAFSGRANLNLEPDVFVKSETKKINKDIAEILDGAELPVYKDSSDFKKPVLGIFGKNPSDLALKHNKSEEVEEKTLNCIEKIKDYLQGGKNVTAKSDGSFTSQSFLLKNGVTLSVKESYMMSDYGIKYDPKRYITLRAENGEEVTLKAYTEKTDAAMAKISSMLNED